MTADAEASRPQGPARLSENYDHAVLEVYRYLRSRCGDTEVAEELTSATFLQASLAWSRGREPELTTGWLITVARNKLIDHWRHQAVVEASLAVLQGSRQEQVDPWDTVLDQDRASRVLGSLAPQYRAALTLRYLDDLSVPECAEVLSKSVHATESLLVRARRAFRAEYETTGGHDD